jgi:hypothetical protein
VSLRTFWELVGGINLVWNYEGGDKVPDLGVALPMDELDPLCVNCVETVEQIIEESNDEREDLDPEIADPFFLTLAPDYLHKANISGGAPYGIELPFLGADPIVPHSALGWVCQWE